MRPLAVALLVVALAGCTGPGLTGLPTGTVPGTTPTGATGTTPTTPTTTTTTTVPTTTTAQSCTTNFAATPDTGASYLGGYAGKKLPNGYNTAYSSEDQVTARITKASGESGWAQYQCNYADAVAYWRTQTGN